MSEPTSHTSSELHSPGHELEHDHHDEAAHIQAHIKTYLAVGVVLMVGTVLTVALAYVDFGSHGRNIVAAMILASIKVGFVAMIFMHLNAEKKTIYQLLAFTVFFCIVLFALTGLAYSDYIRIR